jgi:hypothetical protein
MGLGVAFGVLPYSNIAYSTTRSFVAPSPDGPIQGSSAQYGSGGISSIYLGASYRYEGVHVGISAQPLFGQMNYFDDNITTNLTTLTSFSLNTKYLMTGAAYKIGLFGDIAQNLSVGGFYAFGSKLSYDKTVTQTAYTREIFDTLNLRGVDEYTFVRRTQSQVSPLPSGFGFGASLRSGRTLLGLDIESTNYSEMTINQRTDAVMGSMLRATLGFSQQAAAYAPTFFDKWGYRGGLGYIKHYYTFRGQPINEVFGSAGVDFPLGQSATVDAAIQAGFRGPSSGLHEFIGRLSVTVSIGEVWFKPFARD